MTELLSPNRVQSDAFHYGTLFDVQFGGDGNQRLLNHVPRLGARLEEFPVKALLPKDVMRRQRSAKILHSLLAAAIKVA